jgi:hypothetical protein
MVGSPKNKMIDLDLSIREGKAVSKEYRKTYKLKTT